MCAIFHQSHPSLRCVDEHIDSTNRRSLDAFVIHHDLTIETGDNIESSIGQSSIHSEHVDHFHYTRETAEQTPLDVQRIVPIQPTLIDDLETPSATHP